MKATLKKTLGLMTISATLMASIQAQATDLISIKEKSLQNVSIQDSRLGEVRMLEISGELRGFLGRTVKVDISKPLLDRTEDVSLLSLDAKMAYEFGLNRQNIRINGQLENIDCGAERGSWETTENCRATPERIGDKLFLVLEYPSQPGQDLRRGAIIRWVQVGAFTNGELNFMVAPQDIKIVTEKTRDMMTDRIDSDEFLRIDFSGEDLTAAPASK